MRLISKSLLGLSFVWTTTWGEPADIYIGLVAPMTGPQAHLGKDMENGARLALDEINATQPVLDGKPVTFALRVEDDQADPKTATVVAQKLADEGVKAVIGHLNSGTSIPAARIYAEAGIPQISPCATAVAYTQQGFKTTFRLMANDAQQGRAIGQYATQLGKRVAVIDDRTAYGQGLADEVIKAVNSAGGQVVAREFTTDRATDFTAILTSIKGKRPEVIVFGGMDPQGAPMVRQMKMLGIKAVLMGGDGLQTANFLKLAGSAAEGVIASSPGLPLSKMPGGAEFATKFNAKFGKIQLYAPFAYDAASVLLMAMRSANTTVSAQVLTALTQTKHSGVSGPVAFDEFGDLKDGPVTLYKATDGVWIPIATVNGTAF